MLMCVQAYIFFNVVVNTQYILVMVLTLKYNVLPHQRRKSKTVSLFGIAGYFLKSVNIVKCSLRAYLAGQV